MAAPASGSFVRPHDIAIFRSPDGERPDAKTGVVSHIGFGGPVVKIELESDDKNRVDVELTAQAYRDLESPARRKGLVRRPARPQRFSARICDLSAATGGTRHDDMPCSRHRSEYYSIFYTRFTVI